MARRGFFSRVLGGIRDLFAGRGDREEEIQEPPAPPIPEGPTGGDGDNPFRDIWDSFNVPRNFGSYHDHFEFFYDLELGFNINDREEQLEDWEVYINYMVMGGSEFIRRDPRNPFWAHFGIDPGDFDWQGWRSAMGDTGRRKR